MTKLHLSKLHATGNDFLVWMPDPGASAGVAGIEWCHHSATPWRLSTILPKNWQPIAEG